MPPQKEPQREVVDMTKQYGTQGPAAGVFQYAHHDEPEPAFDLTKWVVTAGFAKDKTDAQRKLSAVAALTLTLSGVLYWLAHSNSVPPQVHRPALDSSARNR